VTQLIGEQNPMALTQKAVTMWSVNLFCLPSPPNTIKPVSIRTGWSWIKKKIHKIYKGLIVILLYNKSIGLIKYSSYISLISWWMIIDNRSRLNDYLNSKDHIS
jgi:hypothetical protein